MQRTEWSETFALGIKTIDDKHKHFLDTMNALLDAQEATGGQACLAENLVDRLKAYATEHFHVEEGYMQAFGYPEYETHRAEHDGFLEAVSRFEGACAAGAANAAEILDYLQGWMRQHLVGVDRQMGRFLDEYLR